MEKFRIKINEICEKLVTKSKEFYNFLLFKTNNRPYIIWTAFGILLVLIIFFFILIFSWSDESADQETVVETWDVEVADPVENPPLTREEQVEICSTEANKKLRAAYNFEWDEWTITKFSVNEESYQLKWVAYLDNEESVLAQCTIESGLYRDTEVRVGFLDDKYYSLEKFNKYVAHCEGLWWKLTSRWWYGHWMIWSCEFDNWTSCDLRELYRWNCRKGVK